MSRREDDKYLWKRRGNAARMRKHKTSDRRFTTIDCIPVLPTVYIDLHLYFPPYRCVCVYTLLVRHKSLWGARLRHHGVSQDTKCRHCARVATENSYEHRINTNRDKIRRSVRSTNAFRFVLSLFFPYFLFLVKRRKNTRMR